jgi:hypothetical protein
MKNKTVQPMQLPKDLPHENTVIVGNTGSGKSAVARGFLVEPLLEAKRRVCIIDPTGIWWGLRFWPDGSKAYEVPIFGGLYGDRPIGVADAESVAEYIGGREAGSNIIDLSELTIGDRHEFATHFFAHLYRSNRLPLHLIADEADEFAPQQPLPETRRLLHHFDRIVRRGRVRGFRMTMITQRPSVLHKNVMSQAKILIAMQLLGSQDRAAVELWIRGQGDLAAGKEVLNTLAKLQTGEGWLWAPAHDVLMRGKFFMFKSFDSSRTPKDDEPPVEPPGAFQLDPKTQGALQKIPQVRLEEQPRITEQERANAAALIRRKSASGKPGTAVMSAKQDEFVVPALVAQAHKAGEKAGWARALAELVPQVHSILKLAESLRDWTEMAHESRVVPRETQITNIVADPNALSEAMQSPAGQRIVKKVLVEQRLKPRPQFRDPKEHGETAGVALLRALARFESNRASQQPLDWRAICIFAGLLPGNGYYYGGKKWLLNKGFIVQSDSQSNAGVNITKAGMAFASKLEPTDYTSLPPTLHEAIELWSRKLIEPGPQMLRALALALEGLTTEELSRRLKIKSANGYWYKGVKVLRDANLVALQSGRLTITEFARGNPTPIP